MKKLYNIPTEDQLGKIAYIINTELFDIKKDNMSIVFELSKDLLRQVDEEWFIKRKVDGVDEVFIPGSEVVIIADGIVFKFIEKLDGQEENKKKQG